ncbi:D-2-hydroxyacid dehydrogenase [Ramlibacter sp.]|uniref:D-2-hydroxyacid dehydrogenase n=1 Tax=Ramlibacter sp. TaxID=1917967 RepID=UPI00262FB7B2|nr:D-2-hydroxyacid dehydrogenase [Ramlibacter sp.]MDB5958372.1 Phosphoglycerate dehydrogenase [Ramlibacter sp.]
MRIVYWARLQLARQEIIAALAALPGVELQVTASLAETLAALPGAQALVLVHGPQEEAQQVFAALRAPGNTVRWMHFISAGREGYEELGWPPGIVVSYAGGGVAPAVAEHAMALMLALCRRVPDMVQVVMARRAWDRTLLAPKARSLEGATLVIVGHGHIGRELARRSRSFDMRIVTVARTPRPDPLVDEALPLASLHAALAQADVVAVTIALTPETTHLLGEAEFAACKKGALVINVARGPIIDQPALVRALHAGQIGGAGLDVSDPEPLPADDPLWNAPNVLVSPHFAGSGSPRSVQRLAQGVADNLRRLLAGQPLEHVVSP